MPLYWLLLLKKYNSNVVQRRMSFHLWFNKFKLEVLLANCEAILKGMKPTVATRIATGTTFRKETNE